MIIDDIIIKYEDGIYVPICGYEYNKQETFEFSDMFIEAGANTVSGLISFVGGYAGGVTGVHIPGQKKRNLECI